MIRLPSRERADQNSYSWRNGPSDSILLHCSSVQTLSLATGDGKLVIKRPALTAPRSRPPHVRSLSSDQRARFASMLGGKADRSNGESHA